MTKHLYILCFAILDGAFGALRAVENGTDISTLFSSSLHHQCRCFGQQDCLCSSAAPSCHSTCLEACEPSCLTAPALSAPCPCERACQQMCPTPQTVFVVQSQLENSCARCHTLCDQLCATGGCQSQCPNQCAPVCTAPTSPPIYMVQHLNSLQPSCLQCQAHCFQSCSTLPDWQSRCGTKCAPVCTLPDPTYWRPPAMAIPSMAHSCDACEHRCVRSCASNTPKCVAACARESAPTPPREKLGSPWLLRRVANARRPARIAAPPSALPPSAYPHVSRTAPPSAMTTAPKKTNNDADSGPVVVLPHVHYLVHQLMPEIRPCERVSAHVRELLPHGLFEGMTRCRQ